MAKRPNILILMADQLRADALGCYGNEVCQTPHLDALARSGVLFENGLTPDPICVPARAALTTGSYPHRCTGVKDNGGLIRDGQPKLAEHFSAHGYRTTSCGKLHYVPYAGPGEPRLVHGFQTSDLTESGRLVWQHDPQNRHRGLEDYIDYLADVGWAGYSRSHGSGNNDVRPCPTPLPPEHHVDHWVADRSIARLHEHLEHHAGEPFLLFCSSPKPHTPLDPPYDYVKLYDPRDIPPPVGSADDLASRNPVLQQMRHTHGITTLSPKAMQVIKAYYYALITHLDAQFGRVLAALDAAGVADDTIVVFTADHGDLMGDFGAYFKGNFLRGSAHVPFLVRGPGIPAGERRKQLVGLQDILPTLARMTGCPLDGDVHGLDLTDACQTADAPVRDLYYAQCFDAPRQLAMLFDGRWKYCWSQQGAVEELYDLAEDPHELSNLATRPDAEALLTPWREGLIAEARRVGDTALFDGDGRLATAPLDREAFKKLPVRGMGWRWY
ncbi:MAG: sulfatase-like hydrolase/transferase [Candidatus Brocadiae bacterium]|nr:sulfatase-like hydrolase/transferase [Candidatus Brocadiia bacterium]